MQGWVLIEAGGSDPTLYLEACRQLFDHKKVCTNAFRTSSSFFD